MAHPAADGFRVIYHEPICPDCGSFNITRTEVPGHRRVHRNRAGMPRLRHRLAAGLRDRMGGQAMTGSTGTIYLLHFSQPY